MVRLAISVLHHFPIRRKRMRKSTYPWLDKSIVVMMRRRDQFHRKARKFKRSLDWTECRRLCNLVTSLIRKAKKNYFADKLQDCKSNPRSLCKTLNLILPHSSSKDVAVAKYKIKDDLKRINQ